MHNSSGVLAVDVMVPFVSGVPMLLDAIASVRAQHAGPPWRLTVVDNGGRETDVALPAVEAFGDDRIRYVVLLHSDDEWEPDYLSELERLARAHPAAAAFFTSAITIDESGTPMFSLADRYKARLIRRAGGEMRLAGEDGMCQLLRGNFLFASSLCLRRDRLLDGPFDARWDFAPDYDVGLRLLASDHTLVGSPRPLCRYRRHGAQTTLTLMKEARRFEEEVALYDYYASICDAHGWPAAARVARRRWSLRINLVLHAGGAVVKGRARVALGLLKLAR